MASSCRAISTCRKTPKRRRPWSRSMAAAGSPAGATPFNIGGPISPRAALRSLPFPIGSQPKPIGLLGASAGAHLAALAALSGKKFLGAYPHDPFAATDTSVKALIGVYGVYDMHAMWTSLQ